MDQVLRNGGMKETAPHDAPKYLGKFVSTSTEDVALIQEFHEITATYEHKAQELKESGIPQRRAEIIQNLLDATTPSRTYAQVGALLDPPITGTRVYQILRDARRREARRDSAA